MERKSLYLVVFAIVLVVAFHSPLATLVRVALEYDHYSHIILIPVVTAALVYWDRKKIFSQIHSGIGPGVLLLLAGVSVYGIARTRLISFSPEDTVSLTILSFIILWWGGFVVCYGARVFRAAAFPLLFLILMVPLPGVLLDKAIVLLQKGSAEVAHALFRLAGVPVFREGFVFALPGITIEVAKECSGIRSSLALFITSLLAGHFFLRAGWSKVVLSLSIFPLLILKNSLRIATLSLLAIYVDRSFLTGALHQYGGSAFFVLALAVMVPVLRLLQRAETQKPGAFGVEAVQN